MLPDDDAPEMLPVTIGPVTGRRRPTPWHVVFLSALLVILLGLGGATVLQRSAPSGRSTVSLDFLAAARAKTVHINDFRISMTMKLKMSGQQVTERMDGELRQNPFAMSLGADLPGGFGRIDERAVDHTLYMRVANTNVGGKHWIGYTMPAGSTGVTGQSDPLATLQTLAGARGTVTRAGTKTIDGTKTTRYRAAIDPRTIFDQLPKDLEQALPGASDAIASMGLIPVDVYIADDGTVRRMTDSVSFQGMTANVELNLTPLGRPAHVVAPRPSDVVHAKTFTEVFQDLGLPLS
jgi:hypothetical protein